VTGEDGWPLEYRGIVQSSPGLYFVGLAFQYAFASMLVAGAGRDAEFVVKHLVSASRSDVSTSLDPVLGG
jgi:putative flavoprotein involved in K+ transport